MSDKKIIKPSVAEKGIDKAKLIELLKGFGIVHTMENGGQTVRVTVNEASKENKKVGGYADFFVDFEFASDGRFDCMVILE